QCDGRSPVDTPSAARPPTRPAYPTAPPAPHPASAVIPRKISSLISSPARGAVAAQPGQLACPFHARGKATRELCALLPPARPWHYPQPTPTLRAFSDMRRTRKDAACAHL